MKKYVLAVNRVEGDLKIQVDVSDGVVVEARCAGIMFRGIEQLMKGRGVLDGLVITPRICGICSTSHLKAAARALDGYFQVTVPDNAVRVRNCALMVEMLQNDIRHAFLMFMPDLANPAYASLPLHGEAAARYTPLKGNAAICAVREMKKITEVIAILGGQWPHSSFMVPGGVVSMPSASDAAHCRYLLGRFRDWYEKRVLGCTLERFGAITSQDGLMAWLAESESHARGDLGFFIRFASDAGLDRIGGGAQRYISFGGLPIPFDTPLPGIGPGSPWIPSGFFEEGRLSPFDPARVTEDLSHTRFADPGGPVHPFLGQTRVDPNRRDADCYSFSKAPRYDGKPAETGPLAEMVISGHPLIADLLARRGSSVFVRQLARMIRPGLLVDPLDRWLKEISEGQNGFFQNFPKTRPDGQGFGLIEAPRGALGHWMTVKDGKIDNYQIITPTAWNASPADALGNRGPMEQALIGTPVSDGENPIEVEQVVRSFDPCLVCTVHAIRCRP
jgi:hydrogenase large subunit